jgi:hypothetical protein
MKHAPGRHAASVVTLAFFGLLLMVGVFAFDDYGISWDEPFQRDYGRAVYDYVAHADARMLEGPNLYYGPAFEMVLLAVESVFGLEDTRDIYLMRHLVGFLLFFLATVFFFKLSRRLFGDWRIALLGSLLFVTSPRIFAHAFFNPKDLPLMALFTIGMFTLVDFLDHRTLGRAFVHAFVCAVAIDIRIVGVMLVALTLGFALAEPVRATGGAKVASRGPTVLAVYLGALTTLVIAFWPTLWRDPISGLIKAFAEMSHYPLDLPVKYMGRFLRPGEVPWHYTLVWIGISTPIVHLACFAGGLAAAAAGLFKRGPGLPIRRRNVVLLVAWFFIPIVYLPVSGAVVFDEWRHVFFIYPALVGIGLLGIVSAIEAIRRWFKGPGRMAATGLLAGALAVGIGSSVVTMISDHPFEHVYFNAIVGGIEGADGRFDLDYWGLSYRRGLEYVLEEDRSPVVGVSVYSRPGISNAAILPTEQRSRLEFIADPYQATYFLTHERWNRLRYPPREEFYSVRLDGVRIMLVLKDTTADSVVTVLGK